MLNNGQVGDATDFITLAERNANSTLDAGRVAQLEADGELSPFFTKNGAVLLCGETINGATTPVPVWQNKTDNELYACDANDLTRLRFMGFVISNGTNGNPAVFQGSGVVGGFTGLDEGEEYYVQDAVGTIGLNPGTYEILVGVAISPTELLIQKGPRRFAGNGGSLGTASGSLVVTCGFRPSRIRVHASAVFNSSPGENDYVDFVWLNGTIYSVNVQARNGASALTGNGAVLGVAANNMTFTITAVTDTGFTITWTETGTFNPTASSFYYEAEGLL